MKLERKLKLARLAFMMNRNTKAPIPVLALLPEIVGCFDAIITDEDLGFLLRLGSGHYSYAELRRLSGKIEPVFQPFFERILGYQLVERISHTDGRPEHYELNAIMIGWFEGALRGTYDLTPERVEFARRMRRFFAKLEKMNFTPLRQIINFKMRFDPVWNTVATPLEAGIAKTSLKLRRRVETPDVEGGLMTPASLDYYLAKFAEPDAIALCDCFCRKFYGLGDEPCRYEIPLESCVVLGTRARHVISAGMGRAVTPTEARRVIMDCYAKGAMLNIHYEHSDMHEPEAAICLCCPDCCGSIGSYNRGMVAYSAKAYYLAQAAVDKCVGCKLCEKYCATGAIKIVDKQIVLDEELCIGCGQCAFHCQQDAVTLIKLERQVFLPNRPKSAARF